MAIVEGETEQVFVNTHLATHLRKHHVSIGARLPGRMERRGGVPSWQVVRGDILHTLRKWRGCVCTTMFDFYAIPSDWPGRTDAANRKGYSPDQKGNHVEQALLDDLAAHAGADFRRELFIPYVQVHEFEAILFSNVATMATTLAQFCPGSSEADLLDAFQSILAEKSGQAESINDNYDTCPSRRITALVRDYRKFAYGPIIADRIGLNTIRAACPHFGQWLGRLEALGP
jgi:hypothetical protein